MKALLLRIVMNSKFYQKKTTASVFSWTKNKMEFKYFGETIGLTTKKKQEGVFLEKLLGQQQKKAQISQLQRQRSGRQRTETFV